VRAGHYSLAAGVHELIIQEREDGIALDQILLTPSAEFVPFGPIRQAGDTDLGLLAT